MYLECLTVCVDFGDFLATALPINRPHFDRYVLVTGSADSLTQNLAREHDCILVISDRYRAGNSFNKGRMINDGLDACTRRDWLCLLDADIVLPEDFRARVRRMSKSIPNAEQTLCGVNRLWCHSYDEWLRFRQTGHCAWKPEKIRRRNQRPAGYLQLWNARTVHARYTEDWPKKHRPGDGVHGDLLFGRQFKYYYHFPDLFVIHLSSVDRRQQPQSPDWHGRKSTAWPSV